MIAVSTDFFSLFARVVESKMTERDTAPSSSNAGDAVHNLEEVSHKTAREAPATAQVHETPAIAREVGPRLVPKEAWKDPAKDATREIGTEGGEEGSG